MANDNYNKPLKLINNKPSITQMVNNNYLAYALPQPVIEYANKVLTDRQRRLYIELCGQANGFTGAMSLYCARANITVNHYSEVLRELHKKGFIIHTNFETIEVLFPTNENEYISPTGKIEVKHDYQNGKSAKEKENIKNSNSQISNSALSQSSNSILPKKEEQPQNGNEADHFGNYHSQMCGNNRDINNNKELIESTPSQREEYENEVLEVVRKIGARFQMENRVMQQLEELRKKGFSNEFILCALENKKIEDFSMGINLLFYKPYQEEIKAILKDRKAKEQAQKEQLERNLESFANHTPEVRIVKFKQRERKPIIKPIPFPDFFEEEKQEEQKEEVKKVSFADLI